MDHIHEIQDEDSLEEKNPTKTMLTRAEKRLKLQQSIRAAHKTANASTNRWIPGEARFEQHLKMVNACLRKMESLSEKKDPARLQGYVRFIGFSKPELEEIAKKLESRKQASKNIARAKERFYASLRTSEGTTGSVDSTIEDETFFRKRVQDSYRLATVTPIGKPSEQALFIDRHSQTLNICLQMMDTLDRSRLSQFENVIGIKKIELEDALAKFVTRKEGMVSIEPSPLARQTPEPLSFIKTKSTSEATAPLRSIFTRLLRTFGFGSNLEK